MADGVFEVAAGSPWPHSQHGEVFGPSGERCYTAIRAGEILGTTDRTVRSWVSSGRYGALRAVPTLGKKQYFLLADGVEQVARDLNRWPPVAAEIPDGLDAAALSELLRQQGRDLERVREALASREEEVARLRQDLGDARSEVRSLTRQRKKLAEALAAASAAAVEAFT